MVGMVGYSAGFVYRDAMGRQELNTGFLPPGALPIDLAHALGLPLFASDVVVEDKTGVDRFVRIDPAAPQQSATVRQHPLGGALLGGTGRVAAPLDAKIILVGSSIYVPDHDRALVRATVAALATLDYVGALFVHDSYGAVPGAFVLVVTEISSSPARLDSCLLACAGRTRFYDKTQFPALTP